MTTYEEQLIEGKDQVVLDALTVVTPNKFICSNYPKTSSATRITLRNAASASLRLLRSSEVISRASATRSSPLFSAVATRSSANLSGRLFDESVY